MLSEGKSVGELDLDKDSNNNFSIDEDFVNKLQTGDKTTSEYLVNYYQPKFFTTLKHRYGNQLQDSDCADLIQDTFLKIFDNIKDYPHIDNRRFSSWLYTILRNTAIDYFRHNKNKGNLYEYDDSRSVSTEGTTNNKQEQELEYFMKLSKVRDLIEGDSKLLNDSQKLVLKMKFYDCLSNNEIANKLGESIDTINTRIFYSRKKIVDYLGTIN
ncbi:MAG: hypothetical protein COY69_01215 [Candidatus Magasanikbacteria bacterium CG_4_10_14_0_8_um_filter_32_14]|uniref:RNA polymerase sigma-70 region 2 domain-containing protein n=2 Tax=Candidatus Magasanikiibacteriota TaxID=1752731 RepID=A0A2M7RAN4_9BACT|nr:MAG: hypothetical protein AUJ23_00985 [Candidatus Magasanikbacteria bacterium CG1_02_32_51]PIY93552.1 MAG: hypothetical protein COY69_01215 [Candidatus Magasanikbacteria bacterium CG_4_10_14_0_8_um_filter_32_14]